jgi:hypothetical protein
MKGLRLLRRQTVRMKISKTQMMGRRRKILKKLRERLLKI